MRISRILILTAALGLSVCLAVVLYLPGAAGGRNDFLGEYAAGRLAGTPGLYDIAATERVQIAALGELFRSGRGGQRAGCKLNH